jgi:hypothetical protein
LTTIQPFAVSSAALRRLGIGRADCSERRRGVEESRPGTVRRRHHDLKMPNEDGWSSSPPRRAQPAPAIILASGKIHRSRRGQAYWPRPPFAHSQTVSKPHTLTLAGLLSGMETAPSATRAHPSSPPLLDKAEIERALEAGYVEAWFQPQIEISTRRVVGVEALLRCATRSAVCCCRRVS